MNRTEILGRIRGKTPSSSASGESLPRDPALDATVGLLRRPYDYIGRRCRELGTDVFSTRLMLEPAICMTGPDASRLFYDRERFQREGAMPGAIQKTLLGRGGVQGLDGAAHLHRKALLMSLMSPSRLEDLSARTAIEWERSAEEWRNDARVVLYEGAQELLTRAVCGWAGVPLPESDVPMRTRQLTLLFDAAGAKNLRHVAARLARRGANAWAESVVQDIRAGRSKPPEDSAAHQIAWHRDLDDELLSPHDAAVDLLNILRPTVAIAVWVTLIAHALHEHCDSQVPQSASPRAFCQEVRRFYPFFPAVVARVKENFEWRSFSFSQGTRVLLDLHGTNHDPRTYDDPREFRPDRFDAADFGLFDFIPQGGGHHDTHHRCAGEWITMRLMEQAFDFLAHRLRYRVPEQNLTIDRSRMPALPRSRFVIADVSLR